MAAELLLSGHIESSGDSSEACVRYVRLALGPRFTCDAMHELSVRELADLDPFAVDVPSNANLRTTPNPTPRPNSPLIVEGTDHPLSSAPGVDSHIDQVPRPSHRTPSPLAHNVNWTSSWPLERPPTHRPSPLSHSPASVDAEFPAPPSDVHNRPLPRRLSTSPQRIAEPEASPTFAVFRASHSPPARSSLEHARRTSIDQVRTLEQARRRQSSASTDSDFSEWVSAPTPVNPAAAAVAALRGTFAKQRALSLPPSRPSLGSVFDDDPQPVFFPGAPGYAGQRVENLRSRSEFDFDPAKDGQPPNLVLLGARAGLKTALNEDLAEGASLEFVVCTKFVDCHL